MYTIRKKIERIVFVLFRPWKWVLYAKELSKLAHNNKVFQILKKIIFVLFCPWKWTMYVSKFLRLLLWRIDIHYIWKVNSEKTEAVPMQYIKKNEKYANTKIHNLADIEKLLEFHPNVLEIWDKIPRWIIKADIGRILLVYEYGGFYSDIDVLIMKNFLIDIIHKKDMILFIEGIFPREDAPFDFLNYEEYADKDLKKKEHIRIANYFFGCMFPKHPFLLDLLNEAVKRIKICIKENIEITDSQVLFLAGPDVFCFTYHKKDIYPGVHLMDETYLKHMCYNTWKNK